MILLLLLSISAIVSSGPDKRLKRSTAKRLRKRQRRKRAKYTEAEELEPITREPVYNATDDPDVTTKEPVTTTLEPGTSTTTPAPSLDLCATDFGRDMAKKVPILRCLICKKPGASPRPGKCQEYDCGGDSGVHYYTCCNNCDETCDHCDNKDTPEYDGASDGNYCGKCGKNLGKGCKKGRQFTCGGLKGQKACKDYCDRCAITFPGACWNWTKCFSKCCKDGDPSDGVDGWICL